MLVVGGIGTGKSTTLAAIREVLTGAGVAVLNRPPRPGETFAAFVVDDGHLLADTQLSALADAAGEPSKTVVVATEPRNHDPALRDLTITMEREGPRIALGPLDRTELSLRVAVGDPPALDALLAATGGIPFLVEAACNARSADSAAETAHTALVDRLRRLDEPLLATILVMSLSTGLGAADVAAALGADVGAALMLADQCYATGLFVASPAGRFTAAVHRAVAQLVGAARHHEIESALLHTQFQMSTLSIGLAMTLAEHGLRDKQLAEFLESEAMSALPGCDATTRLLRAAVHAGAVNSALQARLADALALAGDCPSAGILADGLLETDEPTWRGVAVRVAASVAAHDGNNARAAELFGWLATHGEPKPGTTAAAGAIVLLAAGRPGAARDMVKGAGAGPPTLSARRARSMAEGLLLTLDGPYAAAAAALGQAIAADVQPVEAMPDSASALVALAALHAGDAGRARSVIGRAPAGESHPLFGNRHRLLSAWISMQEGRLQTAASTVSPISATAGSNLHRRDALWAAALQTAIARRSGDTGALQRHWLAATDVLAEYSIDLFCLLPLGELWVSAARLRQAGQLTYALDQAFGLLSDLGDPAAWSLPLHWAGVHAAILANAPESITPHGQALIAAADSSPFATALAGAGRAWLRVLASQVDAAQIAAAARDLARFGLTWDATRLTGQAALQTPDSRVSGAMLQLARDLKLADDTASMCEIEDSATASPTAAKAAGRSPLSDREREVAELLLLGMPYRDIGSQLFISPKTVEHHVARMRRRLGAQSRAEMLSILRAIRTPEG